VARWADGAGFIHFQANNAPYAQSSRENFDPIAAAFTGFSRFRDLAFPEALGYGGPV
jgi:hypothetical protein